MPEPAPAHEAVDPPDRCYPVVVVEDRYGGSYSGGLWIAFGGFEPSALPLAPFADAPTCANWWDSGEGDLVGRGPSPSAAVTDLIQRWTMNRVLSALAAYHDGADFVFEETPERLTDMIEACQKTLEVLEPIRPTGAPS